MEQRTLTRTVASCVLLAIATAAAVFASNTFSHLFHHVMPVWSSAAVALAWMLCSPPRRAPALVLASMAGSFAVNLFNPELVVSANLATAAIFAAEAGAIYYFVRRLSPGGLDVGDPRSLAVFTGVAAGGAAFAGLATAAYFGVTADVAQPHTVSWVLADLLGMMILPPCVLILRRSGELLRARPFKGPGLVILVAAMALSTMIFFQERYPLLFLVPPLMLLASLELELLGAAIVVVFVTVVATAAALTGHGATQFLASSEFEKGLIRQAFLLLVAGTSLGGAAFASQRREIAEALTRSHEAARTAVDRAALAESVARIGHWRVDAVTCQLTWSEGMYAIFGLDRADQLKLTDTLGMFHPDDQDALAAEIQAALRGEAAMSPGPRSPVRLIRRDGEMRYITGRLITERDDQGSPVAVFGTLHDITDQHVAQMAVAESEARYRMLADNVSDVIIRADPLGTPLYASPSIERVLGVTPAEAIRQNQSDSAHPDDAEAIPKAFADICAGKLPVGTRVRHRRRHAAGHYVWLESAPTPLFDDSGALVEILDVVRDITHQKALEDELEAARREAEAAAEVKARFLANMSHELRTPLTAVLGFSSLLAGQPELSEATRDYVARINTAGAALLSIINDVLDFSKLEAGGIQLRAAPTAPGELFRETVDMFATAAEAKGIGLQLEGLDALPEQVELDGDRVRQLLLNLIGNAVKFTDAGVVTVKVEYRARDRLHVMISDTGPGVPRGQRAQLFKRFSQVDGTQTRRHGGSGLGLAICKALVDAMGGSIGLQSRKGAGSTFWFTIPAPRAELPAPSAAPAPTPRPHAGLRVLVVDDHPVNRQLARAVLEPFGVVMSEACGGHEAVQMATEQPFDLILMDVRMPEFDGLSAMQAIRAGEGPNRATIIVAFSAEAGDHAPGGLDPGFDGHVPKPITVDGLSAAVGYWSQPTEPRRGRAA